MIKTILLSALIVIGLTVTSSTQLSKALTNEEIIKQRHDYFNNVVWPGFQRDCRFELGIGENVLLTGDDMMNCKQAQFDRIGKFIPDLALIDMHKIDNIKLYLMAVVENSPLP